MAISIDTKRRKKFYNGWMVTAHITLDNAYPNPGSGAVGGWSLSPSAFGLSMFDMVVLHDTSNLIVKFDNVNNKIRAFKVTESTGAAAGTLTELTNKNTSLNAKVVTVIAIGY